MELFDTVIIGSGPSGVAAARELVRTKYVCVLDVGDQEQEIFKYNSFSSALHASNPTGILGNQYEVLRGVVNKQMFHAKLKSEELKFVLKGDEASFLYKDSLISKTAGSFAVGGMSNVWGAQLLRYTHNDMKPLTDWPISIDSLQPYYDDLENHIGISGAIDDMHDYLGHGNVHMPPVPICVAANSLFKKYQSKNNSKSNLILGRARVGVLTNPYRNYRSHEFAQTDFFSRHKDTVYSARRTLEELKNSPNLTYMPRCKVIDFKETEHYVEIFFEGVEDQIIGSIKAKHLLIATGTIQTAKLVATAKNGCERKFPFIDHPPTLIPFFMPSMFGNQQPTEGYPIQLIATMRNMEIAPMISIYYLGGMLLSELIGEIPFAWHNSMGFIKNMIGGMLVAQMWSCSRPLEDNFLTIAKDGKISIQYNNIDNNDHAPYFIKAMRSLGAFSHKSLISKPIPGWGFHYAGTLPMKKMPTYFETHCDGRLWDSKRIRVVDGSVLPSLPAKNHSLTMMANAARIANEVLSCEY